MTCPVCEDTKLVRKEWCPVCEVSYSHVWDGGYASMRIYLVTNGIALLIVLALWIFLDADSRTPIATMFLFLLILYTTYRFALGVLDMRNGRRLYRGSVTDISSTRLIDLFGGADLRLKIGQRRFKLEDAPLRQLQKGQEVVVFHTPGTKTITSLYRVSDEEEKEQAEATLRQRRTRLRRDRK